MSAGSTLRLGTRASLLARTQSQHIADCLQQTHAGLRVELVPISTSGDRLDGPLADAGGKGLFTKELELALLAGEIDLAVHSLKDVPVTMPLVDQADLILACIPARQDPRDALVSRTARSLSDLSPRMKVGTGSPRRQCQILALRPDVAVHPLRGNVDTRLRKLEAGQYDAIILATAGLTRLGLFDAAHMHPIDPAQMLPAAGQGALALQCRREDAATRAILAVLNDSETSDAVAAERAVVAALNGNCHSPIAAHAVLKHGVLTLTALLGQPDGRPPVARAVASVACGQWRDAVRTVSQAIQSAPPII